LGIIAEMKVCSTIASNFFEAPDMEVPDASRNRMFAEGCAAALAPASNATAEAPCARRMSSARALATASGSAARATSSTMSLGGEMANAGFLKNRRVTIAGQACGNLTRACDA
jgi:hypothetical protein